MPTSQQVGFLNSKLIPEFYAQMMCAKQDVD